MAAIAGANMWAVLRNNDPGHSADDAVLHGRKLVKKAAAKAEEVAPPPRAESVAAKPARKKRGTKKATKRGAAGGGQHKQAAPAGAMDDMMERFTRIAMAAIYGKQMPLEAPPAVPAIPGLLPEHQPGGGEVEVKETPAAAAPSKEEEEEVVGIEWEYEEMGKVEEEGEFVAVVAKGGTVARPRRARKAAAAEGAAAGGANMWAVLGDDDPGHGAAHGRKHKKAAAEVEEKKIALADNADGSACSGSGDVGAKPAKRGKKTNKKKKKCAVEAEDFKQAATMDNREVKIEVEDKKQAVAVTVDDGDGGCRAVARAVAAAAVIALWCRLVSPF